MLRGLPLSRGILGRKFLMVSHSPVDSRFSMAPDWLLSGHQLCEPGQIDIAAAYYADDGARPAFAAEAGRYRAGARALADDADRKSVV